MSTRDGVPSGKSQVVKRHLKTQNTVAPHAAVAKATPPVPALQWYSQIGQDRWVCENVFKHKRGGFYVDVGAFDGKDLSNTYVLEHHYGWRGICVEPMAETFAKLVACRPNSINVPVAAYDKDFQVLEFQSHGILSGASDHVDHAKGSIVHVPTMTLTSLFKLHGAPKEMDFLSVDAEGSDFHVLQGIDWNTYSFKAITVEHNYVEPIRSNMKTFLASKGYSLATSLEWDDVYVPIHPTRKSTAPTQPPSQKIPDQAASVSGKSDPHVQPKPPSVLNEGKTALSKLTAGPRDLRVSRPIEGGLGDCLLSCLIYATAGKAMGANNVYCVWAGMFDLNLVKKYVTFPANLVFTSMEIIVGGDLKHLPLLRQKNVLVESLLPNEGWWRIHDIPGFTELKRETFIDTYRQVAAKLNIQYPVTEAVPKSPYAVLHVRGMDRRDDSKAFVANTQTIVQELQKAGFARWVVVTDDVPFAKVVAPDLPSIQGSATNDLDRAIRDLFVLFNASAIVQHAPNGWSAFSHLASCVRNTAIINTCPESQMNYMMHLIKAHNMPASFFSAGQLSQFLSATKSIPSQT